jgi:hypothetical protein
MPMRKTRVQARRLRIGPTSRPSDLVCLLFSRSNCDASSNFAQAYSAFRKQCFACDSFKFKKRRQLFIRVHKETLSVVAMRVSNPDRSPAGIPS